MAVRLSSASPSVLEHSRRRGRVRAAVRQKVEFARKLKLYKKMGFDGVQFHDDDAVASVDVPHAR